MNINSRIYIIGCGAIGKALAVFLKLAGREVILVRGSVDDGSRTSGSLAVELPGITTLSCRIDIFTISALEDMEGLVVLASKSFGNDRLAVALRRKTGQSPVVILQNGLGVEQPFITAGYPEICRCVLFVTSQSINDNTIRFRPVSVCPIGMVKGDASHLHHIAGALDTPYFRFRPEPAIGDAIWKKLIINVVFNSICPLLDTDNGVFYREPAALAIAKRIINTCIVIAGTIQLFLDPSEIEEELLQISKSAEGQLISTLQDIQIGRKTEIETLNFELVRQAVAAGCSSMVQEIGLLGELTRLKALINQRI